MTGKLGTIVLAAGSSSRMGEPKQLLKAGGKTLIRKVTETAISVSSENVVVITGAHQEAIRSEIKDLGIRIIHNSQWEKGMSTSIHAGLNEHVSNGVNAILILVCDQINITAPLLDELIGAWRSGRWSIACCVYGGRLGTPALFTESHFSELFALSGDKGAKIVLENHSHEVQKINFPGGEIDLDTPEDVQRFL